jgi:hypothetical protein
VQLGWPSKPLTGQGVDNEVKGIFKNFAMSVAHCVLIKTRLFALKSTKVKVFILYLL